MALEAWVTWLTVAGILAAAASNRYPTDVVFLTGLTFLLVVGVFPEPTDAFLGFANPGTITIAALFVVAAGLRETGAIDVIGRRLLGRPRGIRRAQLRLTVPVAIASGFLNNTPIVAMLIPVVNDWARSLRLSPSKFLIPLSYAAIFGGVCTLIGTSTNLVVFGLVREFLPEREIGFFDVTRVGLPCAIAGIAYVVLAAPRLLPDRKSFDEQVEDARGYAVELVVEPDSPIVGDTIEGAGLRNLPGLFLTEIERDGHVLVAVGPTERIRADDRLVFVGIVESIADVQKIRGLVPATNQVFKLGAPRSDRRLVEAVVSANSPLVGLSVRDGRFRTRYDAAIIAISRQGERLRQKIGDVVLEPGDTLLLETHPEFVDRHQSSRAFYLVSEVANSTMRRHERAPHALIVLLGLSVALATGVVDPSGAALVAAGAMIVLGCLPISVARRSLDGGTLLVIAAAFGVGKALEVSGAAAALALALEVLLAGSSPVVALLVIYVITNAVSEVMNNAASAVLVFPVALEVATGLGVDPMPFAFVIMVAASGAFATPIGYQTNLMVYGPGGYRFGDYTRFGLPLNVIFAAITVTLAPIVYGF